MADFLSEAWFADLNASLAATGPAPVGDTAPVRVVFEFADAPGSLPHALTFTVAAGGASVAPGDHLGADALVRLGFADARALTDGALTSAEALRDGRIKVRGDLEAVVSLTDWLRRARPLAEE
ncbi:MAG: SCP2 sterol-binding domain-containing protein [Acidobacteriota bacterium]|nr:SCP2 sterol-binding domain-containing protein [Acidobacteriota bacterium]